MNVRQRKKLTARLMASLLRDDLPAVRALLRAGADPNAADRDGTTPLYLAALQNKRAAVRILLDAGADPNIESGRGEEGTPLTGAAAWGHAEVVGELLARGGDPNLREDHGNGLSPFEWAVRNNHAATQALLTVADAASSIQRDRRAETARARLAADPDAGVVPILAL
ncbi:ankyrin repeat domain-containing protein [Micromonospora sp. NPDC053740]|uniref:ankyrin repeat domain-containing protein n=1 Tax=Micromonospora TaxID=1873 RepID=UPI001EE870F0|nr:ankyrin repeat domain-containing protein [Micromonospora alfalfae]MCG5461583.1 ankyrin repeat domain-containing protein [Micromonospora alfalfae]